MTIVREPLRVLVCSVPESEPRLRRALEGDELLMAYTSDEAMRALMHADFDVLVLGMMFDESRALEFLARLRAIDELKSIPVAGIRGARLRQLMPPEVFDLPMRELGARDVIDFAAIPDNHAGAEEIGRRIRACAAPAGSPRRGV